MKNTDEPLNNDESIVSNGCAAIAFVIVLTLISIGVCKVIWKLNVDVNNLPSKVNIIISISK